MLMKKSARTSVAPSLSKVLSTVSAHSAVDRRSFLRNSGLAAAGVGLASVPFSRVRRADATAAAAATAVKTEVKNSVCTFCSVGCGIKAEVQNGVWVGQEPDFDNPINLGGHCAKGAASRDEVISPRRLKYPMKLVDGRWTRIPWDQAINEIGDKMEAIRKASGPDSVYWLGSAKFGNEQGYLYRKFASFWGTNNTDHQARICHSSTVAGVANTWGYGAMTNTFNDMHNSKSIITFGGNPAEGHPVSMVHILRAKEQNKAHYIVVDPRFTRTAAMANEFVQPRPGSDIAVIWGILWHILENGWEDKEYLNARVWGFDHIRKEVAKWTPEEVQRVSGVPGAQLRRVAETLVNNKPACLTWTLGMTQHTIGVNYTRAMPILMLALGSVGVNGGGTNIFRGHDNVQGITDMGVLCDSLPFYYGLAEGSWKHFARVWEVDYDFLLKRFASKKLMETSGTPVSRWYELVLQDKKDIDQPDNVKAMVFWGHSVNSLTRLPEQQKAFTKLDLLVIVDPYVPLSALMGERKEGTYLLPACTQFETYGTVTSSGRSVQWREKIVEPMFESKPDEEIMYLFARKFGFEKEMFKNIKITGTRPENDDILREINRGAWTIGYTGQSPERLKLHMQNKHTFDKTTLRANGGPCSGDHYGLSWPCWGTPEMKHPGTPHLYIPTMHVKDGGMNFRAGFGLNAPEKWDGGDLLAAGDKEGVSYSVGSEIKGGYPEFTMALLMKMGWDKDLTPAEMESIKKVGGNKIEEVNWKTDLSGGIQRVAVLHGCVPFGNGKARCVAWNFPDPVPIHREPLYTPRRDLVEKYPTYSDRKMFRVPTQYASIQAKDFSKDFPIILSSGCLVEHEGGGAKSFANVWLAELQQEMFIQINPHDANNLGIRDGSRVQVDGPEGGSINVKAWVTTAVAKGNAWVPYHFMGRFEGKDLGPKIPEGTGPYVMDESGNILTTYGYDAVTNIQETKVTLCRIRAA